MKLGISADQIAADVIGKDTRLPSLEVGLEEARQAGNCDSGYSCAYTYNLAWRTETQPLPPVSDPRALFERLFGADADEPAAARARRLAMRQSILDEVLGTTNRLQTTLGGSDRRKLDEYLTSVREIERQVERAATDGAVIEPGMEKPFGIPVEFPDYFRLMTDMMVLAFKADLTRISTMIVGREGSVRAYPEIGVNDGHHPLTHHQGNMEMLAKVRQINELHAKLFAEFVVKLKNTPEGRFQPARSIDDRLRQRPVRWQRPHARPVADAARRPRRRLRHAGASHHLPARDAGHQLVPDDAASGRGGSRSHRRFDGTARRHLAFMTQEPKGPAPVGVVYNTSMARADAALALAALYVSASRREARVDGICVTGSSFDAAVFCDIVARVYTAQTRPSSNSVLPIGFADGASAAPAMVERAVKRRRDDGQPQYSRGVQSVADTGLPEALLRNAVTLSVETVVS